jgi:hypothetical protein
MLTFWEKHMFIRAAFKTFLEVQSEATPVLDRAPVPLPAPHGRPVPRPATPPRDWTIDWRWLQD